MEISFGIAFIAGLVSFISPCVLPLVPAYLSYMGGRLGHELSPEQGKVDKNSWHLLVHSILFVLGFSLIFVLLGLASTAFVALVGGDNLSQITDLIGRFGGILIVFFGLHFMGLLPAWLQALRSSKLMAQPLFSLGVLLPLIVLNHWAWTARFSFWLFSADTFHILSLVTGLALLAFFVLGRAFHRPAVFWEGLLQTLEQGYYRDTRQINRLQKTSGYFGSFAMGLVFAAGWTPCIGPVYGAVLTMAANGGSVPQAGIMLSSYALGLGVPFLLCALMLEQSTTRLAQLRRHTRRLERFSGVFLILIGVTVATGQLQRLSAQFAGEFADFSVRVEESVLASFSAYQTETGFDGTLNESVSNETVGLDLGQVAPDFETTTLAGEALHLYDRRGHLVLLNFWATWCGPCRIEMPFLDRAAAQYADQGFQVLAINNREDEAAVARFRDQLGLRFTIAMDRRGEIQDRYGIVNYPTSILIDAEGRVAARHFGILTAQQLADMVDPYLQ